MGLPLYDSFSLGTLCFGLTPLPGCTAPHSSTTIPRRYSMVLECCWLASRPGGHSQPDQCPEKSAFHWGTPSLESPYTQALKVEIPGREVKNPGCAPQLRVQTVEGDFCSVKSVVVVGCCSHGSPCGGPGKIVPRGDLSSPRWRRSSASAWCDLEER